MAPEEDGSLEHPFAGKAGMVVKGLFGGPKFGLTGTVLDANGKAKVHGYNQFIAEPPAGHK
ncbi:hypothetical protein [Microbacterium deminutum]|uniref:Uncharacterized protein n=1 Tax=Microbacterium deminutum TaxID=344164 RepID=A0ABN2RD29_9MICO